MALPHFRSQQEAPISPGDALAARVGIWTSGIVTGAGIVYGIGLLALLCVNGMRLARPSAEVQLWVGLATFGVAPFILAIVVCIHRSVPEPDRVLTQLGLAFTVLFTSMVSINRFVQLTVVRKATISGETEGLTRFLPYSSTSVTFALEILGWGVFLGITALVLAPVFRRGTLESAIRWTAAAYGVLSLTGAIGYAIQSRLFIVGFLAWGFVLYIWTGMLLIWFSRILRALGQPPGVPPSPPNKRSPGDGGIPSQLKVGRA
jgi:hypothetical protein